MATMAPAPKSAPTPQPIGAAPTPPPPPPAAKPAAPKSRLGLVKTGQPREAKRFHFYGPGGVGKTLLAADAIRPIFFDGDTGSGHLALPRYPFRDGDDGHVPRTLAEVYAAIDDLLASPHEFQTLVIDTAGAIERLIHTKVVGEQSVDKHGNVPKTIGDIGYGRGGKTALVDWRVLLDRLDALRLRRGMHIVLISHQTIRKHKSPISEDYGRYEPDLDIDAAGAIYQWCDVVGFVSFDDVGTKGKKESKATGQWSGRRVIHLEHAAAWDAKSRLPLPAEIDLPEAAPWAPITAAIEQLYTAAAELKAQIETELARLGETFIRANGAESTAAGVRTAVTNAGDNAGELSKFLNSLRQAQPKEQGK